MQYTCVSNSSHLTSVFKISVFEKVNSSLLSDEQDSSKKTKNYVNQLSHEIILTWWPR